MNSNQELNFELFVSLIVSGEGVSPEVVDQLERERGGSLDLIPNPESDPILVGGEKIYDSEISQGPPLPL